VPLKAIKIKEIRFLKAVLFILVFGLLIPYLILAIESLFVTLNVLFPGGNWRPLNWITEEPMREIKEIKSFEGRTLTLYLYLPQNKKPKTGVVFYTPLIGQGPQDSRLVNLAETFSREGMLIVIPWRKEEQKVVTPKDIDDVISTSLFLLNHPDFQIKKIGLVGFSYGSSPVIIAAGDERIKKKVAFLVSFGGYYDLKNVVQFLQTGNFSYKNIKGKAEPHDYGIYIFKNTLEYYKMEKENFLERVEFEELRRALSPAYHLEKIKDIELFIIHSTDDRYIPYTESLRLKDARSKESKTHLILTEIFEHGDYKPFTLRNILILYLPTFFEFYKMFYLILLRS
jgi:hypothetical protein